MVQTPNFRLKNVLIPNNEESFDPVVERTAKIGHIRKPYQRCEGNGHCYGCDVAELKTMQEDIHAKVA